MTYYHTKDEALAAEALEYRAIKHIDGELYKVGLEKRLWEAYEFLTGCLHGRRWEGLQHITEEELCKRVAESLENTANSESPLTFAVSFRQHVSWMYWHVTGRGIPNA